MNQALSLACIGGGLNSEVGRVHFAASRMDRRFEFVAGAFSRHAKSNQDTAKQWGVAEARCYPHWQELIQHEQGRIDAALVLLPSPRHAEVVNHLLRADIPVICEKPMATSLDELHSIERSLAEHPGFLAITYNYSGYPMLRMLRALLSKGQLGKLLQLQVEMPQEGFLRPPVSPGKTLPQAWRLQEQAIPMVSLDLGLHLHHLCYFLIQEHAEQVMAEFNCFADKQAVVDDVKIWARYQSGVRASYWFSKSAIGYRNGMRLRLFGTRGSAEWSQLDPDRLLLNEQDGRSTYYDRSSLHTVIPDAQRYNRMKAGHPSGFIDAFANLYHDLADELQHYQTKAVKSRAFNSPYVFGLDQAKHCLAFFHAASLSHQTQTWVDVSPALTTHGHHPS